MKPANPPPAQLLPVVQADRIAADALAKWLFDLTEGKVNMVAEGDEFPVRQMFAAHRIAHAPEPALSDAQLAEEIVSAANIVSHDGYYELDIDRVTDVLARHRAPSPERGELASLVERLRIMSKQRTSEEMDEEDQERADWQGAYDWFCAESRWLLAALQALSATTVGDRL